MIAVSSAPSAAGGSGCELTSSASVPGRLRRLAAFAASRFSRAALGTLLPAALPPTRCNSSQRAATAVQVNLREQLWPPAPLAALRPSMQLAALAGAAGSLSLQRTPGGVSLRFFAPEAATLGAIWPAVVRSVRSGQWRDPHTVPLAGCNGRAAAPCTLRHQRLEPPLLDEINALYCR